MKKGLPSNVRQALRSSSVDGVRHRRIADCKDKIARNVFESEQRIDLTVDQILTLHKRGAL